MTPAERRTALVERMLEAFANASGLGILPDEEEDEEWREDLVNGMSAAIDLALEEAEQMTRPPAHMLGSTDSYANGYRAACDEIAAALRAYVSASAPAAPPPASSQ